MSRKFPIINKKWTLFLDRDGVINQRIIGGYVKTLEEFRLFKDIDIVIAKLSKYFGRVFIVTNQQGIGKGLMTEEDLSMLHNYLFERIRSKKGWVDAFYFAPNLAHENSILRKPNIGMGLKAKSEFPEIEFKHSIMVGDSESDIDFAHGLGAYSVYISDKLDPLQKADITLRDLQHFLEKVEEER